jgi:hypothetical protein
MLPDGRGNVPATRDASRHRSTVMRSQFTQHLAKRGWVDPARAQRAADEALDFHEIIGAIALKHSLMTPDQIDHVLGQLQDGRQFGEVARELGYLSTGQVENLLVIQELHETFEVGQTLVLEGRINRNELLAEMAAFFADAAHPSVGESQARGHEQRVG